tara:strand:- start:443 stop:1081 length:639 start_codon:yes stop_codon:yes gene_type:complete
MRCKINDQINIFNENDKEFHSKILEIKKYETILEIFELSTNTESINDIFLIFSLVKKNKMDLIIQKATELGVKKIFPILTERSSIRDINTTRMLAIAKEASEQSNRISIPEISNLQTIQELLEKWDKKRSILYADEILKINKDLTILKRKNFVKSSLLVGPEGGFSPQENDMLKTYKYIFPISFGETILKSDTAAIVGLSYLNIINSSYKIN